MLIFLPFNTELYAMRERERDVGVVCGVLFVYHVACFMSRNGNRKITGTEKSVEARSSFV